MLTVIGALVTIGWIIVTIRLGPVPDLSAFLILNLVWFGSLVSCRCSIALQSPGAELSSNSAPYGSQ